ncbi:long-chain acyl-CoA synthetase [Kroppenstedtia sanguinis]|uniref:Acyl-CoA synthetase n=1 Tax=Kroppenstedtia sanguinis TaxID=1380684 RepID=A0ABW4C9B9_9BACL
MSSNLLAMVWQTVERGPDRKVLMYKEGGAYRSITYGEMWEQVRETAAGLAYLGVEPGDKVAILSNNNPMWPVTDLAVASLAAVSVPIYPTLTADQVQYILKNADCRTAVVETEDQLHKIRSTDAEVSHLIVMKPTPDLSEGEGLLSFDSVREVGRKHPRSDWEDGWRRIGGDQLFTIIHTSGTTGPPKGAMLTHRNLLANIEGVQFWIVELVPEDVCLSYLPLSHVFERMAGQFVPMRAGATIAYAESIDTIEENLLEVRPTVMTTVPRLLEKIYAKVQEQMASASSLKQKIFNWAVDVGRRRYDVLVEARMDLLLKGESMPSDLRRKFTLADRLVFRQIKDRVGGRLRGLVSGAAPLNPKIARFFWSIDIPVLEGYGLTEASPVISANPMMRSRIGTVGKPLPNLEVKMGLDGEILARGPSIMQGYYKNEEATRKAIQDGWLHTGDLGEWTPDGFLRVVDRKKNLIVLSTGKNVAPQPVENHITNSRYISQAVVIGNGRKYVIALVVPNYENLLPWAGKRSLPEQDPENLAEHPEVKGLLQKEVDKYTKGFAAYEIPKKTIVCGKEWSIEGGELTPTLKVKVNVVEEKYQDLIEAAYAEAAASKMETIS